MFCITWKLGFVCEFESWSNYVSSDKSIRIVIVCLYNVRGSESSCMGLKTRQSDINLEETIQKPGKKEYETKSSMYIYDYIVKKNKEHIRLAKSKSLIKMFDSEKFD